MASKKTKYKNHEIEFYNLLTTGHNMDKFVLSDTVYHRPDHNFDMILRLLKKSSVVYDIGSYIGTFAIPMAIEGMEVYAFEGFPDNFERCKKNCKPYGVTNYLCAVSDKNYSVESKFNNCMDNEYEVRKINYFRLDDFMESHSLPEPSLVKMDIEGMEAIALHGMTNLLENIRPIWSMGYHFKFYSTVEGYPGWIDIEDGGYDFQRFDELGYWIFDELGRRSHPRVLQQRGGEFIFIPEEKIKR
jgi:FkbM family methyltransferase